MVSGFYSKSSNDEHRNHLVSPVLVTMICCSGRILIHCVGVLHHAFALVHEVFHLIDPGMSVSPLELNDSCCDYQTC